MSAPLARFLGLGAALAAAAIAATPSRAADLGGDCCADLEERIAELEATTARKGNRKVSLRISGQVNHAVLVWDDGGETNAYEVMNSNSSDRVNFSGDAVLAPGWRAGYFVEIGLRGDTSSSANQVSGGNSIGEVRARSALWFVESKNLGTVSVGLASPSTDDITGYNLGGTNVAASSDGSRVGGGLFLRDASVAGPQGLNDLSSGNTISLRWRRFMPQIDTPQTNIVRYDTPVFMGFAASASWGEDDFWDVALRYAKDYGQFRVALGGGYLENSTETDDTLGWPSGGDSEPGGGGTIVREAKGSASLIHVPSGVFLSGAYVHRAFDGTDPGTETFACFDSGDAASIRGLGIACSNRPDFDYYWINAGIRRKFFDIGWTSIYGEYGRSEDAITGLNVSVASARGGDLDYVTESTMELWGLGLVQHVSAASMDVYFSYKHFSADVTGLEASGARVVAPIEDADLFMAGSRIRF